MTVRIINANVFEGLAMLPDESVHCVVTSPRKTNGQFQKGTHWRPRKLHWDREWLSREYTDNERSTADIANEMGCTAGAIQFWLKKHGIQSRDTASVRAIKHWGAAGKANPMFGKIGELNPRYVDGSSPERQRSYVQAKGKEFLKAVYKRDGYCCRRCSAPKAGPRSIHAHHIKPWAGNEELRFDINNAVTLCRTCHSWVHSLANVDREWLS